MNIIIIVISAVICYLFGSISSSILVGKSFGLRDIRKHGSGNAGATNTLRVLGKKAAILTVIGDVLKTAIAMLIARFLATFIDGNLKEISVYISAFSIAIGHNFPAYFKFKGGKGVLASGVIIIMLNPVIGTVTVLCAITIMATTRYVSLGSISAGLIYIIWIISYYTDDIARIIFSLVLGLMLVIRHSSNINRLISGTESKLGAKKEIK
ncbi:MAG: glycerol-3-phosphate 1-O-acyltransferase PlsY [Monoglobales bacterium]